MTATPAQPGPGAVGTSRRAGLLACAALAAATVLAQVAYPLTPQGTPRLALTGVTVVLFYLASTAHAAATRGRRAGLAVGLAVPLCGLAVEAIGVATGLPFGRYTYTGVLGVQVLDVPAVIPLAWAMMAYPTLLAVRLVARSRLPVALAGGVALAGWDLFLDPMMVGQGVWSWTHPSPGVPGLGGIPWTNVAGWLLVGALLTAGLDRAVAAGPHDGDAIVIGLWLWVYASSVLADAVFLGRPAVAAVGAVGMGLVALPVARRAVPAWRVRRNGRPVPERTARFVA